MITMDKDTSVEYRGATNSTTIYRYNDLQVQEVGWYDMERPWPTKVNDVMSRNANDVPPQIHRCWRLGSFSLR